MKNLRKFILILLAFSPLFLTSSYAGDIKVINNCSFDYEAYLDASLSQGIKCWHSFDPVKIDSKHTHTYGGKHITSHCNYVLTLVIRDPSSVANPYKLFPSPSGEENVSKFKPIRIDLHTNHTDKGTVTLIQSGDTCYFRVTYQ